MFGNTKNVFWEALILTLVVFILGFLLGMLVETQRVDKINEYYLESEISLMDMFVFNNILNLENVSCEDLKESSFSFADRIYEEALLLEDYEYAGKLNPGFLLVHKKYDLLRTFLWINTIKNFEKCDKNFNLVIYLYELNTENLVEKAEQTVWSKILFDLKLKHKENVLLIPIAVDSNVSSLTSLLNRFEISSFPAIILNEKKVITEISSLEDIEPFLI